MNIIGGIFFMALVVTNENFEAEVINSTQPVLVDFWATWCGPCKMLAPTIDEISKENTDFKVCKVDIDQNPELAQRFGIMSIPTLVVLKNGEEVTRSVGVKQKEEIIKMVK